MGKKINPSDLETLGMTLTDAWTGIDASREPKCSIDYTLCASPISPRKQHGRVVVKVAMVWRARNS